MHLIREKVLKIGMITSITLLCLAVMTVILFGIQQFKIGSQLASINQVANLSHLLVRQQANLFSMLLVNQAKSEKLTENLDDFVKEEFVLDAAIYGNNGELLAQSTGSSGVRDRLGLDDAQDKPQSTQQIVEPIYSPNGIEGFLRVTFDMKYGQTTQNKINQIFHQLYGEVIVVFLVGVLLASSVHYFLSRYRRLHHSPTEPISAVKNSRANSLNYHRRRRRLAR
ncbi:YtjB family periplasmic protein [Caviibacterium pharyngocola]|uniref:Hemolysin regulation protein AhpA n=1 Tax=Caviibacterium pharyngocola TaxID=28159 RepID=A0A2M8RYI4_9PAST|nr:YtjB family periplasmic protein [Caviibacterium pharyngocola]PJG83951.1 hemolysin regulation protein AhpA [Caviibacterium pharyngocola]